MTKQTFQYNLIRFQPNVETGEFAVVGVVAYSASKQQLEYQLLESRQLQRVIDFFRPIDERILPAALKMIKSELTRVQQILPEVERPDALYAELIREREDIIRFAPTNIISGEHLKNTTVELFKRYAQRDYQIAA